jgi:hypothetical protein
MTRVRVVGRPLASLASSDGYKGDLSPEELEMPLSDEAARRFAAYATRTAPSSTEPVADHALFEFVGWALVREPEALGEPFAYERNMSEHGFSSNKMTYVQTVLGVAQRVVDAYEQARRGLPGADPGGT